MRKKRFLAALLAMIMVVAMIPATAFAEENKNVPSARAMDENGLHMTKTATLEDDGTYTIDLEAFVTGTVTVTNTTTSKPTDVVLVLDISGSMYEPMSETAVTNPDKSKPAGHYSMDATTRYYPVKWNGSQWQYLVGGNWYSVGNKKMYESRMGALMEAVNSFINATAEANNGVADSQMHSISIVTFNGTASTKIPLTKVDEVGRTQLLNAVTEIGVSATGSTNAEAGMETAGTILGNSGNRAKAVIMFTDGVPTVSSAYDNTIAAGAIDASLEMKSQDTTVFTISVLDDANISDVGGTAANASTTSKMNTYMNALSSNYPSASSTNGSYPIVLNDGSSTSGYYKKAGNASELTNIFGEIQDTIISGTSSYNLDSKAVLKDIMNAGFSLKNATATAKVYNYNFKNKAFATSSSANLTATINNDTVSVTGFDYAKHFVPLNQTNDNPNGGKKVVVKITGVTVDNTVPFNELVSTNDALSGMYVNAAGENPVEPFQQPLTQFANSLYVLDYAKPVTVNSSEWSLSKIDTLDVNGMNKFTRGAMTLGELNYGSAAWNNGTVTYTPQSTKWADLDSFYAFGEWKSTPAGVTTGNNVWSRVSFVPASNIYYEDDFIVSGEGNKVGITYGDGWSIEYDNKATTGNPDGNDATVNGGVYGWETSLGDDKQFSDGAAHTAGMSATANFTFTGTGVDIYSYTDMESGLVTAALNRLDDEGKVISSKYLMVDNLAVSNGTEGYYQIPTLSFQDLEYGTYKVNLVVNRGKAVETDANGNPVRDANGNLVYKTDEYRSTYYLDGIRVYNPLGEIVTGVAADIYAENLGIDADKIQTVYKTVNTLFTERYAVFADVTPDNGIKAVEYTTSDVYKTYGPKNEVYLAPQQSVTFAVENADANYYLGLKAIKGSVPAQFSNGANKSSKTIDHSTDLYYKVTPSTDGNAYIVVKNNAAKGSDSLLAVTKLQIVSPVTEVATFGLRAVSFEEAEAYAVAFAALDETVNEEEPVEPEVPDVEPEEPEVEIPEPEQPVVQIPSVVKTIVKIVSTLFNVLSKWFGR